MTIVFPLQLRLHLPHPAPPFTGTLPVEFIILPTVTPFGSTFIVRLPIYLQLPDVVPVDQPRAHYTHIYTHCYCRVDVVAVAGYVCCCGPYSLLCSRYPILRRPAPTFRLHAALHAFC